MDSQKSKKRSREKESDSDSDMETRQRATRAGVDGAWPVYLVVREIEDGLRECTPFLLHRAIKGVSKGLCVHRKLKDGSYIIKSNSEKASSLLLKQDQKHLAGKFKISVSVHKTLNSSRGVVRCAELGNMSVEEIKEELADQGVTDVYRVKTKRAGKEIPTNTYFVTFATPKLPSVIRVGWLQVQVKVFVPSPMRCFNCQRLGHTSKACKSAQLCKCGKEYHDAAVACDSPAKCINCKGDHPSDSRNCPSWIEESNIQRLKAEQGISFAEAKKLAQQTSYVTPDRSFARVASESGTQIAGDQIAKLVQVVESLAERVMALERCVSLMAGVGPSQQSSQPALPSLPTPSSQSALPSKTTQPTASAQPTSSAQPASAAQPQASSSGQPGNRPAPSRSSTTTASTSKVPVQSGTKPPVAPRPSGTKWTAKSANRPSHSKAPDPVQGKSQVGRPRKGDDSHNRFEALSDVSD